MTTADEGSTNRKLRILLLAYEFPPSPSPQSLRWAYLAGRLAELGHEVHVMAPSIHGSGQGLPEPGPAVRIHRVWPGPVGAILGWLQGRKAPDRKAPDREEPATHAIAPPVLNWKGRLLQRVMAAISWAVFPDARGEWRLPAGIALSRLLRTVQPDVVVSSHEPATTLQLGLRAKRLGFAWVADIADPVLARYTPPHWRRRARSLEARTMREADHVVVTAQAAAALLQERHGSGCPITVVTQGFDERVAPGQPDGGMAGPLELLYAGNFYSFRDPGALVKAVLSTPGARLTIASGNVPDWLFLRARECPDQLVLLGSLPHRELLARQRQAHVLVNLANADPCQIPGKFYEYLGAGRPILHIQAGAGDAAGDLLSSLGRGWACPPGEADISGLLRSLVEARRAGRLEQGLRMGPHEVQQWSWTAAAHRIEDALLRVCEASPCNGRQAPVI